MTPKLRECFWTVCDVKDIWSGNDTCYRRQAITWTRQTNATCIYWWCSFSPKALRNVALPVQASKSGWTESTDCAVLGVLWKMPSECWPRSGGCIVDHWEWTWRPCSEPLAPSVSCKTIREPSLAILSTANIWDLQNRLWVIWLEHGSKKTTRGFPY